MNGAADVETPVQSISFWVGGQPIQQGSKTAGKTNDGRAFVRDSNSKLLRPWRAAVTDAARRALDGTKLNGPVRVDLLFLLERPKSHYGTGRNRYVMKEKAPARPTSKPDLDKLARSILDALTDALAYTDDAYVVTLTASKIYAHHTGTPGVQIKVRTIDNEN